MTDTEKASAEARVIAEEKSKQGTFNFLDRLNGRDYPAEDVEIYLDERSGYIIQKLNEQILTATTPEQVEVLEKQIAHHREKARASRYIFHLEGISVEEYDSVVDLAREQYPLEFREHRNPLTAKLEREVVENEDREQLFRTELWSRFVRHIEDADGNVDTNITPEFMAVVLGHAPIAAQAAIGSAVEKLRMVSNWMDEIQGEDFLAKS